MVQIWTPLNTSVWFQMMNELQNKLSRFCIRWEGEGERATDGERTGNNMPLYFIFYFVNSFYFALLQHVCHLLLLHNAWVWDPWFWFIGYIMNTMINAVRRTKNYLQQLSRHRFPGFRFDFDILHFVFRLWVIYNTLKSKNFDALWPKYRWQRSW